MALHYIIVLYLLLKVQCILLLKLIFIITMGTFEPVSSLLGVRKGISWTLTSLTQGHRHCDRQQFKLIFIPCGGYQPRFHWSGRL